MFLCWALILKLLMFTFLRAIRTGGFLLYVTALGEIAPWFFALDHPNYARWIPVHIRDMTQLKVDHPVIYAEFMKSHFAVRKSVRSFSAMAIDP